MCYVYEFILAIVVKVPNGTLILIALGGKMSESGVLGLKMFFVCLMSFSSLMG